MRAVQYIAVGLVGATLGLLVGFAGVAAIEIALNGKDEGAMMVLTLPTFIPAGAIIGAILAVRWLRKRLMRTSQAGIAPTA